MKNTHMNSKQPGMTLIEIMIALAIGAFLLGGVIKIFLGSTQSYRMLENLSRLQENGRFALEFMGRDIRQAGYRVCWTDNVPAPINGTDNGGLNNSDTITIQMSLSACPNVVVLPITYTINNGAGGQPSLFQNNNGNNQELIEGIEDMQILYGADTNNDSTPDYYVPAGTAGLTMNQVVSVRVTLTARTLDANLTTTGDGRLRRTFSSTIAVRNLLP